MILKEKGCVSTGSLKVDKDAAARFIKSAINDNKVAVETENEAKKQALEEQIDISSDEEEKPTKKNKKRKMDAFSSNSKHFNILVFAMKLLSQQFSIP